MSEKHFVQEFLNVFFSDVLEDQLYFNIFSIHGTEMVTYGEPPNEKQTPKKASQWFKIENLEAAAKYAPVMDEQGFNVYMGMGLSKRAYKGNQRLSEGVRDAAGIVGLWADIDIMKPGSPKKYARNASEAREIAYSLPLEPTMIVGSGSGGIHAYWLFKEPLIFENDEERDQARELSRDFQNTLSIKAHSMGFDLDHTFDLERIMRVPGTTNTRSGGPVRILEVYPSRRYSPEDFTSFLIKAPAEINKFDPNKVKNFIFDPEAQPPFDKLIALRDNIEGFDYLIREGWKTKKKLNPQPGKSNKYESLSEVDLGFCNYLIESAWTDQEIVNFFIYLYREVYNQKLKDPRYYARTIHRARTTRKKDAAAEKLEEIEEKIEEIKETAADEKQAQDEIKKEIFGTVSNLLGFTITRFIKFVADPPTYVIETTDGRIDMGGSSNLLNPNRFQERVFDSIGKVILMQKRDILLKILSVIIQGVEEIELGPEATKAGALECDLKDYLENRRISSIEEYEEGIFQYMPSRHRDGAIHFTLKDFIKFMKQNMLDIPIKSDMLKTFQSMGIEKRTVAITNPNTGKRTTRHVYILPSRFEGE